MNIKQKRDLKNMIVNILSYITYAIIMLAIAGLVYLALDFLGFMAWAVSRQTPEGFYLGEVTCKVLSNIIVK